MVCCYAVHYVKQLFSAMLCAAATPTFCIMSRNVSVSEAPCEGLPLRLIPRVHFPVSSTAGKALVVHHALGCR